MTTRWRLAGFIALVAPLWTIPLDGLADEVAESVAESPSPPHRPFGIGMPRADQPISIRADELEAVSKDGARHLVFTNNVKVEQADVRIESDRLEAFYPKGADEPDRLVADGHVRLVQNAVEARCEHATWQRAAQRLTCSGDAELRDGDNRVRGAVIEFDLEREVVNVKGGATVLLQPKDKENQPSSGQSAVLLQRDAGGQEP